VFLKFSDGLIDDEGNIGVESTKKFLQGFVDKYVEWAKRHVHA
jgi:chromate reductase